MENLARRRAYVRDYLQPQFPELVPVFRKAAREFDKIQKTGRIQPGALDSIVAIASHERNVSEFGFGWLAQLTPKYQEARDAVEVMSRDLKSHVRANALWSLDRPTPRPFKLRLVHAGLYDKSKRVCYIASQHAGTFQLRELIPDLEIAAAREWRGERHSAIEFNLKLLRDGYIIEPSGSDGYFSITTPNAYGIGGRVVSQAEIDARGLEAIVAEITEKHGPLTPDG